MRTQKSKAYPEVVGFRCRGAQVKPPKFPAHCPVCGENAIDIIRTPRSSARALYHCGGAYTEKDQIQNHTFIWWGSCPADVSPARNKPASGRMSAHVQQLAQAIARAAAEHGRPNSFSAYELARLYGGPSRLLIGRVGHDYGYRLALHKILVTEHAWKGTAPQYAEGRFYV